MSVEPIQFGLFELSEPVGSGSMGVVWRGVHKEQGVPVAVKVSTGMRALVPRYQDDFRREVQAVARLEHPHIITPYDYGLLSEEVEAASQGQLIANSPYLVMEYAGGGSLESLRGVLDWRRLRQVIQIVLNGLAHAHARGVIHRDIKPANVLLPGVDDVRPTIKLSDFGLAHPYDLQAPTRSDIPQDSLRENISGTPHYMAPEQIDGRWRDYGPWTDLYATGIMAFELASGQLPFLASSFRELALRHREEELPQISSSVWLPAGFQDWLRKMSAKDPADRYHRASAAAWALEQLADSEESEARGRVQVVGSDLKRRYQNDLSPFPSTWREDVSQSRPMKLIGAGLGLYALREAQVVSRDSERDRLWAALRQVCEEGGSRAVLLSGPSGYGKSKIAGWLCHLAHEVGGATVLKAKHGPSPDSGHGLPRMMANYYRCVGLSKEQVAPRIRQRLHASGTNDPYEWQALTSFICGGSAERDSTGGFEYTQFKSSRQRFSLLERALSRMSKSCPLIVWLDDVQWGSEAVEFCRYVLEQNGPDLAVLFVLTAREELTDSIEQLLAHRRVDLIDVKPLANEDMTQLVERLLGLSGELAAGIVARVGGSPIFAVELVGDWVQRGVLQVGQQGFVLKPGELALIPDDLHSVWQSRLRDILQDYPADAELALEAVVMLGDEVVVDEARLLCERLGVEFPDTLLERLVVRRMVVPTEAGWSVAHAALRESLERLARERGRFVKIHRACAELIGEMYPQSQRRVSSRLAWHWLQAGEDEKALQPLLLAAQESRVTCSFKQARGFLELYEQALNRICCPAGATTDSSCDDDRRRVQVWLDKVVLHTRLEEVDEARVLLDRIEPVVRRNDWKDFLASALYHRGRVEQLRGEFQQAWALAGSAQELFEALNNEVWAARCIYSLAELSYWQGRNAEARDGFLRALDIYREHDLSMEIAACELGLSMAKAGLGNTDDAERLLESAMERFRALGDQQNISVCLNSLGELYRNQGEFARAEALYQEAWGMLKSMGLTFDVTLRFNLGLTLLQQDEFVRAEPVMREVLENMEASGRTGYIGLAQAALLPCYAVKEQWEVWDELFAQAVANLNQGGVVDQDVALLFEMSGQLAEQSVSFERASSAYRIAAQQWETLQVDDRLAEIQKRLKALPVHT